MILSGISQITLYDNNLVSKNDINCNFFATKEDIDTNSLADITQRGLMEINNFAMVMTIKDDLSNDFSILTEYNLVIITEIISLETAENLNQFCRMKKIGFIYTSDLGLSSFLFTDFSDDFVIEDNNDLEPDKYYIKSITNECPGIVEIDPIEDINGEKKYLKIGTGDFVSFRDVKGMTELNDTPPRPVRVIDKTKFTIEDTSKLHEFTGSGIVEEVKVPRPAIFKSLSEAIDVIYYEDVIEDYLNEDGIASSKASKMSSELINDDILMSSLSITKKSQSNNSIINEEKNENIPWIKMFYGEFENESLKSFTNEKMHLAFLTLHDFFNIHQDLPHFNKNEEIDECIGISLKILSKAKEDGNKWAINLSKIDKPYLENIFKFCKFNFTPLISFLGGIISEEVIKFTGIYKPPNQWIYFNFFSLMNPYINEIYFENKNINNIKKDEEKEDYSKILNIFNEIYLKEISKINIVIIGFNDISYEMLKLFIIMGLLDNKDNKIKIISDNQYEINQKLNELNNFGKNNNISIIQKKINIETKDFMEKDWWINSNIIIDSLPFNLNPKEKLTLIKQSKKDNKILISLNASITLASYEIFLPENKNINLNYIEETPEGPNEKNEIKIEEDKNEEEEDYYKYKNLSSIEEAVIWSKNYFINNFIIYIKYLNELINKSNTESDSAMIKHIDKILLKEQEKEKNKDKDSDISIRLIKIFKKLITFKLGMNYETIVFYSIEIFEELFSNSVNKILQRYPSDLLVKNSNQKFWSGARKEPKKIIFDINNEEHFELIYCMTYLFCEVLKFSDIDKKMKNIKKVIEKYEPKKPNSNVKTIVLKEYSYIEKSSLVQILKSTNKDKLLFKEIELNLENNNNNFDNIEEMNKQLKFIILAANIKLSIFGLNEENKTYAICNVLNINQVHPAVSSSIAGMVVMQLLSLIGKKEKENENEININKKNEKWIKNCIINLANNTYLFFDLY